MENYRKYRLINDRHANLQSGRVNVTTPMKVFRQAQPCRKALAQLATRSG